MAEHTWILGFNVTKLRGGFSLVVGSSEGFDVVSASATLKAELLRLLKEDEEFRFAVAGLLGLDTILSELKKLREDFNTFVKEQEKRWEENNKRWEEAYKRFEAIELELKKLREDFNKMAERVESLGRRMDSFERKLDALGARWGIMAEEAFREGLRGVVESILGVGRVARLILRDDGGEVYGYPSDVEVDIVIKNNIHVLVEIKSSISRGDVATFWRIGKLYEKTTGVKPKLVMVTPYVDEKTLELARNLGIEVYTRVS